MSTGSLIVRRIFGRSILFAALLLFAAAPAVWVQSAEPEVGLPALAAPTDPPTPGPKEGLVVPGAQVTPGPDDELSPDDQEAPAAPETLEKLLAVDGMGNDVYHELFIGVPFEDVGSGAGLKVDGGIVQAIFGSAGGLAAPGNRLWSQDEADVADSVVADEAFGFRLAAGDYNGDSFIDLAVGIAAESIGGGGRNGAVHLFYGNADGLTTAGNTIVLLEATPYALAAGDFNRDGISDLAAGLPNALVGSLVDAGVVWVYLGTPTGIDATLGTIWHQDVAAIQDTAETGDLFGVSLAAADFDGDTFTDLAVGAPGEMVGMTDGAGGVNLLYGSPAGLTGADNTIWYQGQAGILDASEAGDRFGQALTAADFNHDGYPDLAVGASLEDVGATPGGVDAGVVHVLYGSATGLGTGGNQLIYQGFQGLAGAAENNDLFGSALAAGDFNADGFNDLVIGVYSEDSTTTSSGGLHVLYGSPFGVSSAISVYFDEDSLGIEDTPGDFEWFGYALATGNFNGDPFVDLAVSTLAEGLPGGGGGNVAEAGALNVLFGSQTGLSGTGAQFWHQNSVDIVDTVEAQDYFGWTLASSACPTCTNLVYLPLTLKR